MKTGEKIRMLRKSLGVSQEALADMIGVSRRTMINYENGLTCPKEPRVIAALTDTLGLTYDELHSADEPELTVAQTQRTAQEIIDGMCALFEGNELSSEDKEEALRIVTEAYWSARMKSRGSGSGKDE